MPTPAWSSDARAWAAAACLPWLLAACSAAENPMAAHPAAAAAAGVVAAPTGPGVLYYAAAGNQLTTLWGGPVQYLATGSSNIVTQSGVIQGGVSTTANLLYGGVSGSNYYLNWAGTLGTLSPLSGNADNLTLFFGGSTLDWNLSRWHGFTFYARGNGNFCAQITGPGLGSGQSGPYLGYNYYTYVFGNPGTSTGWRQYSVEFSQMIQTYGTSVPLALVLPRCWGLCFQQVAPFVSPFTMDLDDVCFY